MVADTIQLHPRGEYFIAVRKGRSVRNGIFGCWEDAKDHLGPDAEFAEFDDIHEAAKYAFGRDVHKPTYSVESLQPKCDQDEGSAPPVFEELSPDILNHIFSFTCSQEIEVDYTPCSGSISAFIPSMGLVSKSLYKSCVAFVRNIPCALTMVFGTIPIEKLWNGLQFFMRNSAMLGSCTISVLQEPIDRITTSVFLKVIESFDLSSMQKINIPRIPSRFFEVRKSSQWDLAKAGIPLDVLDRADSINEAKFYKELAKILSPAKFGSLNEVEIQLDILHFSELNTVMNCVKLEYLSLHLYHPFAGRGGTNIPREIDFVEILHSSIQNLPMLKVLKITTSLNHTMGLRVSSNSLQSILMHESAFNVSLQELNCPLLQNLKVGMHLESSLDPLISCYRTITDLCIHCHTSCTDIHRVLGTVEKMPKLKKIDLVVVEVPCTLTLKSSTVEDVTICGIGPNIALSEIRCPMMKKAEFTFDNFDAVDPFAFQNSSTVLETLSILCIDEPDERYTGTKTAAKMDQLNRIVEQSMPRLKTLDLAFGDIEGTFVRHSDCGSKTDLHLEMHRGYEEGTFPAIQVPMLHLAIEGCDGCF